jgi:YbbR domain-containing protein
MPTWQRRVRTFLSESVVADWRYKLIALGAAFVIWVYVAGQQTIQAGYSLPIYFQNVPEGHVMISQSVNKIEVTIAGRRDRVLAIKDRQLWASLDLSKMKSGRNDYRLSKDDIIVPQGLEIKSFFPRHILVFLVKEARP